MNQLNSIIVEGNLVRACALTEPKPGFKVCTFSVGVNRWSKGIDGKSGQEEVSFFYVETYGKMAEICMREGSKGRGIRVVGRLKQSRWEENGKTKSKVFIVAEHVEFKPKWDKLSEDSTQATAATTTETTAEPATTAVPAQETAEEKVILEQAEAEQADVSQEDIDQTETEQEAEEKVPVTADGAEEQEPVNY